MNELGTYQHKIFKMQKHIFRVIFISNAINFITLGRRTVIFNINNLRQVDMASH